MAGFVYGVTGVGLWQCRRWAARPASLLALTTALVAGAFGLHVMGGGVYEMQTAGALGFRLAFWTVVAVVALRSCKPAQPTRARPDLLAADKSVLLNRSQELWFTKEKLFELQKNNPAVASPMA